MSADICSRCGAYVFPKYNDTCLDCGLPLTTPPVDEPAYPLITPHEIDSKSVSRPENIWVAMLLVYLLVGLSMMLLVYIWK